MYNSARKLLFVVNEPYFFVSHRLPLAIGAIQAGYEVHIAAPCENVWAPEDFETRPFFESHKIHFHEIPLSRRGKHPLEELATICALFRLYRQLRPHIVHNITPKAVLYGGIVARLVGIPAIVSAFPGLGHFFVADALVPRLIRWFLVRGYRLANGHKNSWAIIQNLDDAEVLHNLGVTRPGRSIITRGSGVALDEFKPADHWDTVPLVVLPARMIWEKGVGDFVEVARRLRESGLQARFALIGNSHSSNPRAVPEKLLRRWHEEGVIEWWGRRDDMSKVFAKAQVVCLPSTYGEGIPKVLLEAAACGRAIITYDVAGCREAVVSGVSGILVPAGDLDALVQGVRLLVTDSTLSQRMGMAGRALAEAEFGVDRVVEQTLSVYKKLSPVDELTSVVQMMPSP